MNRKPPTKHTRERTREPYPWAVGLKIALGTLTSDLRLRFLGVGTSYNSVLHLEPCGFGSLIRLRSQTAPGLQFSRYRRLAGYFNHTPIHQATALRSESRKNTRPHSVRDCRRYSRLICGSTRVRIPPRRVAKKETISDQRTPLERRLVYFMHFQLNSWSGEVHTTCESES